MSGDAKIRKLDGYQPRKREVTNGNVRRKQFEVGMDGYQPRTNEVTKGYYRRVGPLRCLQRRRNSPCIMSTLKRPFPRRTS